MRIRSLENQGEEIKKSGIIADGLGKIENSFSGSLPPSLPTPQKNKKLKEGW